MIFERAGKPRRVNSNKLLYCLLGLPCIFKSFEVYSVEIPTSQLIISPISCVIEEQDKPCTSQVTLNWALNKAESFCIYISDINNPISCFKQQQGQVTIDYPVYKNTKIHLISERTEKILVWAQILVSPINAPKQRPRNRHAWSIF